MNGNERLDLTHDQQVILEAAAFLKDSLGNRDQHSRCRELIELLEAEFSRDVARRHWKQRDRNISGEKYLNIS